ncbi:MAG: SDR family oxidoreductase [Planctomycetes bacterium]|nr:SDR family oxidoreductase [Planctomycetota bacterium]MCB9904224.1 SDR family oxidoreductase [Planctomycetota bacterium]
MASILITGANRGIGLALAERFAARGDEVVAACRESSPRLAELGVRVVEGVDVTDQRSVDELARRLGDTRIDVLVNNAGILTVESLERFDAERIVRQFEVNSIGPLRVTRALLGALHEGSKVAIVTSLMGSMSDNGSGGYYGYRMSKAAVNAAGVSLARDLAPRGIAVVLLHPGMVATEMTGGRGITPEESAAGLIARIDDLTLDDSGSFHHQDGRRLEW